MKHLRTEASKVGDTSNYVPHSKSGEVMSPVHPRVAPLFKRGKEEGKRERRERGREEKEKGW